MVGGLSPSADRVDLDLAVDPYFAGFRELVTLVAYVLVSEFVDEPRSIGFHLRDSASHHEVRALCVWRRE